MKKDIDELVRNINMKDISNMKINIEEFIGLYNEKKAVLLDVRYPFETKVWSLSFSLNIPYNELPDRLDELPNDKLIVCACPMDYRSNMAKEYLRYKGYEAKSLSGGLLELVKRFIASKAKDINL